MRLFVIGLLALLLPGTAHAATDISPVSIVVAWDGDVFIWSNPHGISECTQGSAVVLEKETGEPTKAYDVKLAVITTAAAAGKKLRWQTVGCDSGGYPIVVGVTMLTQ